MSLTRRAFAAGVTALLAGGSVAGGSASPYRSIVDRYASNGHFDGIALVAIGDRVDAREAAGLANRERRIPHRTNEVFRIASVTKQFTALLVMQEVERGTIVLDAPIGVALSGLPPAVAAITMRQLLQNASGLPNLDTIPGAYTATVDMDDLPAYVRRLPTTPLGFAPGSRFSYNNLDFIVAGAVLQAGTRRSYEALLRERITDPLGMHATGVYVDAVPDSHVKGYEATGNQLGPEAIGKLDNFGPAGAMYSTLDDMLRWDRALLRGTLLGPVATADMFRSSPQLGFVALGSWAYDVALNDVTAPAHLIERQGNIGGIQVLNLIAPADDVAVIVLANTDFADLFSTYTKKGLPYELVSLAVARARAA